MQLLAIILQYSVSVVSLICQTDIPDQLRHIVNTYASGSKIREWAAIILYHVDSKVTGVQNRIQMANFQKINEIPKEINYGDTENDTTETVYESNTQELLMNIDKEIKNTRPQRNQQSICPRTSQLWAFRNNGLINNQNKQKITKNLKKSISEELSFSLLYKNNDFPYKVLPNQINESTGKTRHYIDKPISLKTVTMTNESNSNWDNVRYSAISMMTDRDQYKYNFKPILASTPIKNILKTPPSNNSEPSSGNNIIKSKQEVKLRKAKIRTIKRKTYIKPPVGESKNKSMSARLFHAINDSCNTVVNTFRNMFKPTAAAASSTSFQKTEEITTQDSDNSASCNFSFTDYMNKRDALLEKTIISNAKSDSNDLEVDMSCSTCNDTDALHQKAVADDQLKNTIKKLKLGINLYGCDFKKISRIMWPQHSYMTPDLLYRLYRKLIIK